MDASSAPSKQTRTSHQDLQAILADTYAQMDQLIALLTAACEPALRPENTQSAKDKPLT